jgi:hypothetical protein
LKSFKVDIDAIACILGLYGSISKVSVDTTKIFGLNIMFHIAYIPNIVGGFLQVAFQTLVSIKEEYMIPCQHNLTPLKSLRGIH